MREKSSRVPSARGDAGAGDNAPDLDDVERMRNARILKFKIRWMETLAEHARGELDKLGAGGTEELLSFATMDGAARRQADPARECPAVPTPPEYTGTEILVSDERASGAGTDSTLATGKRASTGKPKAARKGEARAKSRRKSKSTSKTKNDSKSRPEKARTRKRKRKSD